MAVHFVHAMLKVGAALAFVAYPLVVYLGLDYFDARKVALVLLIPLATGLGFRLRKSQRSGVGALLWLPMVTALLLAVAALLNSSGGVLAVPTAVNFVLLAVFGITLRAHPTMIERFAHLLHSDLSVEEARWCRVWTLIWCAFFFINGTVAALLAIWAPLFWWTFHTGILSYVGMALLFATEWLLRKLRFRRFGNNIFERWLDRLTYKESMP